VGALRADDDKAIITSYNDIQKSPSARNFTFSPLEQQRISLAYQREMARQLIQATSDQTTNTTLIHPAESSSQQDNTPNKQKRSWFKKLIKRKGAQHA